MGEIQRKILIVILFFSIGLPFSFFIVEIVLEYFGTYSFSSETIFFTRSSCDPQEAEPTFFTYVLLLLIPFLITYFLAKIITGLFFKFHRNISIIKLFLK